MFHATLSIYHSSPDLAHCLNHFHTLTDSLPTTLLHSNSNFFNTHSGQNSFDTDLFIVFQYSLNTVLPINLPLSTS